MVMYVWLLTVTIVYSSFTSTVMTPAAFETKAECDAAIVAIRANSTNTVAECRAVKMINRDNTP